MTQVNLRSQNPGPMSVAQGDESLIHLSRYEPVAANRSLNTGGVYDVTATVTLALPTDGNRFSMRVGTGATATLTGASVDGVNNAAIPAGSLTHYWRVGANWESISVGGDAATGFNTVNLTTNGTVDADTTIYWVDAAAPATLTIPPGFPEDHMFAVIRHGAAVSVLPTGGEQARNNDDDSLDTNFLMNQQGGAWFKKTNGHWDVARMI